MADVGRAASGKLTDALEVALNASPNYANMQMRGMKAATDVERAKIAADSQVKRANIEKDATIDAINSKAQANANALAAERRGDSIVRGARKKAQADKKFAGQLAALGGMAYMGVRAFKQPKMEAPIPTEKIDVSDLLDQTKSGFDSQISNLNKKLKVLQEQSAQLSVGSDTTAAAPQKGVTASPGNTAALPQQVTLPKPFLDKGYGGDGWKALAPVIRFAEGTSGDKGYTTMFTGKQFSDMSKHPNDVQHGGGYSSAAAGAYQFMPDTWQGAKSKLGLKDFSPASQEIAGEYLARQRLKGPIPVYTTQAQFNAAMNALAPEWASLPTHSGNSYYGQPVKSKQELWNLYQKGLQP